jgi:uncharacterized protein (TIGR02118 family)
MARILVLYNPPANPAAFDKYYHEIHVPLAKRIPKLRSYVVSTAPPTLLAGSPIHLVADLTFDSMAEFNAALASPEGQATAADVANFADAGAAILIFEEAAV